MSSSTKCGARCQTKKTGVHQNLSWYEQGVLKEKQFSIKRTQRGCADYDSTADKYSVVKESVYFCREEEYIYDIVYITYKVKLEIMTEATTCAFPTTKSKAETLSSPIDPVILTLSISYGILAVMLLCMVVFSTKTLKH